MILRLANETLTRYMTRSGYAAAEYVPLVGELAALAQSILGWLAGTLAEDEHVADVMLEPGGYVATDYATTTDDEGNEVSVPVEFRNVINAAVSVRAPLGSRTFNASSESLPEALRDGLLAAWEALEL